MQSIWNTNNIYRQALIISIPRGQTSKKTICESNAYLRGEGEEELVPEDVSFLRPEKEGVHPQNIFVEQKWVKARIKEMYSLTTGSFWKNSKPA